ncbi:hypothetical protein GPALN_013208 [Globodera pallida]|nr:hypothetical protein GPALN_013208 [Globodera pallida]
MHQPTLPVDRWNHWNQGWTSPAPKSPSSVTRNFFEMPVTASTSSVMTALKKAVIGVIGVNVNVTVTASTSSVMTALKKAVIGVIGVNVNVMTSSPDWNGPISRRDLVAARIAAYNDANFHNSRMLYLIGVKPNN